MIELLAVDESGLAAAALYGPPREVTFIKQIKCQAARNKMDK
jgi:hypothetical protein